MCEQLRRLRAGATIAALVAVVALVAGCGMSAPPTPTPSGGDAAPEVPAASPDAGLHDVDLERLALVAATTRGLDVVVAPEGFVVVDPGPAPTAPLPLAPEVRAGSRLGAGARTVYAIGDSVMLSAASTLPSTMGGWTVVVDGRVSRRMPEGVGLLDANQDRLTQVVVILLGHNYGGGGTAWSSISQMLARTGSVERVVLVTVAEWSPAQREVNDAIRHAARVYGNVVVADWAAVAAANPGYLARDRVHVTGQGAWALAQLISTVTGPLPPLGPGPYPPLPTVPASAPPATVASTTTTGDAASSTTSSTKPTGSSSTTTSRPSSSTTSSSSSTSSTVGSSTSTTTGASTTSTPDTSPEAAPSNP
jgi:hypothetical protein